MLLSWQPELTRLHCCDFDPCGWHWHNLHPSPLLKSNVFSAQSSHMRPITFGRQLHWPVMFWQLASTEPNVLHEQAVLYEKNNEKNFKSIFFQHEALKAPTSVGRNIELPHIYIELTHILAYTYITHIRFKCIKHETSRHFLLNFNITTTHFQ